MSKKDREANRTARAAAIRKEQAAKERNRRIAITVGIVVVLSAVIAAGVIFSGGGKKAPDDTHTVAASVGNHSLLVGDNAEGTKVVVYEDFLCPYCREFESASRDFLREYADKGVAQVEYRPFHLLQDPYSERALTAWSAVLEKGTPTQALRFHDLLFDNQPYEAAADKPGVEDLVDLAEKAGVKDRTVHKEMGESDQAWIEAADLAAREAGVKGTPTIFVDGKELQGSSIAEMADTLEKMLADKAGKASK